MGFFFPHHAANTDLQTLYLGLSPVERLMVLREFIGVTYRRRFQFFRPLSQFPSSFQRNLQIAAQRQDRKFRISDRLWRQPEMTRSYLHLIFRHYILGFAVQMTRKRLRSHLPVGCPACYPHAPAILTSLYWYNQRFDALEARIDQLIDRVFARNERHLYLYCLLAYKLMAELFNADEMTSAAQWARQSCLGNGSPLGAELEFSNLGRFATYDKSFGRHSRDPQFANFIHFHKFFLEDVSWRLGGYLDHHLRLRRYLPVPWVGGFLEFSLVRLDYLRKFSMPLTRDPGFLAAYLDQVIEFHRDIAPHSLHLNFEDPMAGTERPTLDDYLCLLMLGGDLRLGADGRWQEHRFANNELRGTVQRRCHLSPYDNREHAVVEYSFLRLWRSGQRGYGYLPVIMALKGFQWACDIRSYCREPVGDMLHWAHRPRPIGEAGVERFLDLVEKGLRREGTHSPTVIKEQVAHIKIILTGYQDRLKGRSPL